MHERRFEVVRLWEIDAGRALSLGPGGAALVGLARGTNLDAIGRASRQIRRRAPEAQQADLLAILQSLSEGRYTARQLARVIPEEVVMGSSIFDKAIVRGRAEGRLEEARQVCAALLKRHHAGVARRVLPAIEACPDIARLHRWTLRMSELSSEGVLRLVLPPAKPPSSRHRAPRPASRSRRTITR